MEKNLSCISFTTETDSAQGYEDHPSYLEDIWPALESNLSAIVRIYAFRHEKGKNVDSLVENCREVSPGLYDLGKGKSMVPNKLHEVKFMSFYKGDRNVFYEIPSEAFLIQFLSMWPHRSEIEDDVKMIGLANNDNNNLYKFRRKCMY